MKTIFSMPFLVEIVLLIAVGFQYLKYKLTAYFLTLSKSLCRLYKFYLNRREGHWWKVRKIAESSLFFFYFDLWNRFSPIFITFKE